MMETPRRLFRSPLAWIRLAAALVVASTGIRLWLFPPGWLHPVVIEVEVRVDAAGEPAENRLQVFLDAGRGFNEADSRRMPLPATAAYETVRMVLPLPRWEAIRLDPMSRPGLVAVRSVRIVSAEGERRWSGGAVAEILRPAEQLVTNAPDGDGSLVFRSVGPDPQFLVLVPPPARGPPGLPASLRLVGFLALSYGFLVLFGRGVLLIVSSWRECRKALPGRRGAGAMAGAFLVVVAAYGLIGRQTEPEPVPQHLAGHNLYFHLTEAFLHGRLHLLEEPLRPLREMENPFDPEANQTLRLHDASYYDGRYYVYFGPAPVLSAYLLWRVLTGQDLADRHADFFFLSGALLFLCLTLLRILERRGAKPGAASLAGAVLALGITTGAPYLMGRSVVYEVALASALFWMAAAVFLIAESFRGGGRKRLLLAAGFSLGMAMASRHSFVVPSALVCGLAAFWWMTDRVGWAAFFRRAAAIGIPAALIGALLLVHNAARFGDPAEFGHNYQIGVVDPATVDFLDPANFPYNAVLNLLQPPAFYAPFPYVHLRGQELLDWLDVPPAHIRCEAALGLLVANPYLLLLPLFLPAALRGRGREGDRFARRFLGLFAVLALAQFAIIGCFSYAAPRYALDYLPWAVLFFATARTLAVGEPSQGRLAVRIGGWLAPPLLAWSLYVYLGLAIGRIF